MDIGDPTVVEEGDCVMTYHGNIHWEVERIDDKISPLGVLLRSGMTERIRYDAYSNLVLLKKGFELHELPTN